MSSFKVLWLSRHALGPEQLADLLIEINSGRRGSVPLIEELEVVAINATYPARSAEALAHLNALVAEHGLFAASNGGVKGSIAAVLPGHIAARVRDARYENGRNGHLPVAVWLPVSVPAPAKDGESRGGGFAHSHWECV